MAELPDLERLNDSEKTDLVLELFGKLRKAESHVRELEELQKIYKLWAKNRGKLFPSDCSGEIIRGISLDVLHLQIAGCVSTFLSRGWLSSEQKEYLYACNDDLDVVNLELQGYAGFYFRQLKSLTVAIIEYEVKRLRSDDAT